MGSSTNYTLYGGTPPHVDGSDTSLDAAERIRDYVGPMAFKIYHLVHQSGVRGMTIDEIEAETEIRHQTAGPRVREMVLTGALLRTEERRRTRSGRFADVYVCNTDLPNSAIAVKTNWKKVAIELFGLLENVAFQADTCDPYELRSRVLAECAKRLGIMGARRG